MNLWIASGNRSKTQELMDFSSTFLPEFEKVLSREPTGIVESAPTFAGNARLKARALARELVVEGHRNFSVIADDSGLCVDLLDGRPGVHSKKSNLEKVLSELAEVSLDLRQRTGHYHCSLHFISVVEGIVNKEAEAHGVRSGLIARSPQGANGYAYDSVFLDPETLLSYGELSYELKQQHSHRTRAFESLQKELMSL